MQILRRSALCLATLVVLVSCGGTADETGESVGSDDAPTGTTSSSDDGEPQTLDDYLGAGARFLRGGGFGGGGAPGPGGIDSDAQAEIAEQQRLIEQQIQACMQAQGFEYTPSEVGGGPLVFAATDSAALTEQEYAETQGFGISTRFDALFEGDADLSVEEDANAAYLATLSDAEADAWQLALSGEPPDRDTNAAPVAPGLGAQDGCAGQAQQAVRGDFGAIAELRDEFAELEERIESDARIAQIRRDWVDCMREAGFDYDDEAAARSDISSQLRPFLQALFAPPGEGEADAGDGGTATLGGPGGRGNVLSAIAGVELTPEQDAELDALQDLERAVATASLSCRADTAAEVEEITLRYEQQFIEENLDALESMGS